MKAVQTVWAMIAVITPGAFRHDKPTADLAGKTVATRVGFIVSFFELSSFVFSVR
jgi:hypothetical protein